MSRIHTVTLPDIGEGVVEGEVIEWLKQEGEPVKQDEPVIVVMTDKATVELPSPYPGVIGKHYHQIGEMAQRGKPLYDLELAEGVELPTAKAQTAQQSPSNEREPTPERKADSAKVLATPPVRKMAQELGIDLADVEGTGPEGRITRQDVIRQSQSHPRPKLEKPYTPPLHLEDDEEIPLVGIRRLTADKMVESKQTAPHFSYFDQACCRRLMQMRARIKPQALEEGIKITYMPLFIKALSQVISKYPQINASVDSEKKRLLVHHQQHFGIAMETPDGLIVPVLNDVQFMDISDVIRAYDKLKQAALNGKLPREQMTGSTITISNFGTLGGGGIFATPIINYPEVAILAVNRIRPQPVVKNREVVVEDVLNISWSFDHRVIDGGLAAAVSAEFVQILENPSRML